MFVPTYIYHHAPAIEVSSASGSVNCAWARFGADMDGAGYLAPEPLLSLRFIVGFYLMYANA